MTRWTQITGDPNSQAAREFRARTLVAARRDPVGDRIAYLTELCRGKKVLDVGVVDHQANPTISHVWLHGEIAKAASSCLGVDVLAEAVATLQGRGYNVRVADITRDPIEGGPFEVIVCGEVIEHVGNPGGLFENAAKLLAPAGRMVLTTPNPYYRNLVRDDRHGKFRASVDHVTLWSAGGIAEMAEWAGLKLDIYRGLYGSRLERAWPRLVYQLTRACCGSPAGDSFCKTLIFEIVRP